MNALAGLVNYSDEDASDEENEQQERSTPKVEHSSPVESEPVQVATPIVSKSSETLSMPQTLPLGKSSIEEILNSTTAEEETKQNTPTTSSGPVVFTLTEHNNRRLDRSRRWKALLVPKPIEGVVDWGIPPEPETEVDEKRAGNIAHFLELRTSGHKLNDHLQRNKSFRNPRIYAKLVEFVDLDELGSNFPKDEYDRHGFPKDAYIDGILRIQAQLSEEKALAQSSRTTISFVNSTTGTGPVKSVQETADAMATAMATASRVASRIAVPPVHDSENDTKRSRKWDVSSHREHKRRH
ncbi:HCNGP-like protein-domain-containing protein [Spinellus fusiger]|nr:HCNGP-like protein-domain-containing protein [Spinellus fusiger]